MWWLSLFAASVGADPVDDSVRAEPERQRIPGAALLVMQGGRGVKAEGKVSRLTALRR